MKSLITLLLASVLSPALLQGQQLADTDYRPTIANPEYSEQTGPVVFIDEGHHNFHTKNGRYQSFASLLERDGYRVMEYQGDFERSHLDEGQILVISNALNEINVNDWYLPTPSAFTEKEMNILEKWVKNGGSLFLIADHMPIAGAAEDLAQIFGFGFTNGFVMKKNGSGPSMFSIEEGTLHRCTITQGRNENEQVTEIASFTGQAFTIPDEATPILTFKDDHINLLPDTAWVFNEQTERKSVEGWHQGAYMQYGQGRIVVFGEAAMFSAQIAGPQKRKMGMNHPAAGENYQLLLNIIHWLDGKLD